MDNCEGPCINYCYYKYSIIFILIGIIIGCIISKIKLKSKLTHSSSSAT